MKKPNEDIYIIEYEDSIAKQKKMSKSLFNDFEAVSQKHGNKKYKSI